MAGGKGKSGGDKSKATARSRSSKAGLQFPVGLKQSSGHIIMILYAHWTASVEIALDMSGSWTSFGNHYQPILHTILNVISH